MVINFISFIDNVISLYSRSEAFTLCLFLLLFVFFLPSQPHFF